MAAYMPTMAQLGALGAVAAVGMQGWGNGVAQKGLRAAQQNLAAGVKNAPIAFANVYHGGAFIADGRTAYGSAGRPDVGLDGRAGAGAGVEKKGRG